MNAQAAALVLVHRATTLGVVVESSSKRKEFPCMNAQVDNPGFSGRGFEMRCAAA